MAGCDSDAVSPTAVVDVLLGGLIKEGKGRLQYELERTTMILGVAFLQPTSWDVSFHYSWHREEVFYIIIA